MKAKYKIGAPKLRVGILFFSLSILACKKLIEVKAPITSINAENVYESDATAASVLTAVYAQISDLNNDLGNGSITSISLYAALSSDELWLYNKNDPRLLPFYKNDISDQTQDGNFWASIYPIIFISNSAIEGINNSTSLTPAIKQQLLGEAKFIRAFCYFYLTNLYGDVPLVLTLDYQANKALDRAPKEKVYQQIINDLIDAKKLLSANYLNSDALTAYPVGSEQRVRPTSYAATALLARVYLFTGDYINAEAQATTVINNSAIYTLSILNDVFKKNSSETIWSLQPVRTSTQSNTGDGAFFILPETGPNAGSNPVYLSNNLVNNFEQEDHRRVNWINSVVIGADTFYYAYKYKVGLIDTTTEEYIMMLRLAEQYLIRAEARAKQNNIIEATMDLNAVRNRAGLSNATYSTQIDILTAILHERQLEFFTEMGHRWFDLKRTNNIDAVMTNATLEKGGNWNSYKVLYPISQSEIVLDPNLVQNFGY